MKLSLQIILLLLLFVSTIAVAQKSYEVQFKDFKYHPDENLSSFEPGAIDKSEVVSGHFYRLIQFYDLLKKEDIDNLSKKGIQLLSYVHNQTYLASIPQTISKIDFNESKIRSIWKVQRELKASSDINNKSLPSHAIDGNDALLLIKYYKDLPQEYVINRLVENNVQVIDYNGINNFLKVSIPLDRVDELADLPFIENINATLPPDVKDDRRGRSLHRVNKLDPNIAGARNYTGKGINVLVRDDGKVFEHIDFKGRMDQSLSSASIGDHGDGVAGIFAGAGNLNPVNRGMAHESFIHVLRYQANFLDETMSLFNNKDVIVTNSSYSNGCNAGYTNSTQIVDQQTYDNPTLMHVFSAGNSGQGQSDGDGNVFECGYGAGLTWANITGGHKQGKNVIATANLNYRGEIMESSSRGPAYDGRIKPDIAANGNNHVSTAEEQGYMSFGGTSGAAPVVAGVMAMLHEAYEVNQGTRANAALLKAIMLNTATDLGNKGPDYIYGWGSLNAFRSVLCIEESRFLQETIQQDEQKTHIITVPDNVAELRIMTYWPDPETFQQSPIALLNDLNTKVTSATGENLLPWVLDHTPDPAKLDAPATKGVDFLNNMEQIAVDNPESGDYTLEVNGDLVPFGVNEYYVVWEFRMNEIDIIFPDGGENLNYTKTEVIHWDATGDEGSFIVSHIDSEGNEVELGEASGDRRFFQWFTPLQFSEKSKIKVTRNGLSDESTETFVLANNPKNLEVTFEEREPVWLHWESDSLPVSYNIYKLGETAMEKVITVETDSFNISNVPDFKYSWLAVSANFPDGKEGKRSVAVSTTPVPIALATNDKNEKPCVNQPIIFETQSTDTLLRYHWSFGANSIPEESFTKGPHSVIYLKKGPNLALLSVENDGGKDNTFFSLFVQEDLTPEETEITDLGGGEYTFKSQINGANSYKWDFGDGNTATGKTVTHAYMESGQFTITLEAENSCGIVTEMDIVNIDLTSIEELTESDFLISPNPSNGDFEIMLPDLEGNSIDIQLITSEGEMVENRTFKVTSPNQKIVWNEVSSGMYFLKFKVGYKTLSRKLIVR